MKKVAAGNIIHHNSFIIFDTEVSEIFILYMKYSVFFWMIVFFFIL